jgi:ATP-dependent DNA helicase RecG
MYSGKEPELIEGEVFKIIIPIQPLDSADDNNVSDAKNDIKNGVTGGVNKSLKKSEILVLEAIKNDNNASINDIAVAAGLSSRTVDRAVASLKRKGIIVGDKSKRNGQWEIIIYVD